MTSERSDEIGQAEAQGETTDTTAFWKRNKRNLGRAKWGERLAVLMATADDCPQDTKDNIVDSLANLFHFARKSRPDPELLTRLAMGHFVVESKGDDL